MKTSDPFERAKTETPFNSTKIIIKVYQYDDFNDLDMIFLINECWDKYLIEFIDKVYYRTGNIDYIYNLFKNLLNNEKFTKMGDYPIKGAKKTLNLTLGGDIIIYTFTFGK